MRIVILAVAVLLLGCRIERTPERRAQNTAELARESIERARAMYATSMIKHDARAIAGLFAPGGVLARPLMADVSTPAEIQRQLSAFFRDTTVTWVTLTAEQLDLISGGGAFETGAYEETVASDGIERKVAGRYAIRWALGPEATHRIDRLLLVPQTVTTDTLPGATTGG